MSFDSRTPAAPPDSFRIERALAPGRYPLGKVFPGLDRSPAFKRYPAPPALRRRVASETEIAVIAERTWMYVAPHEVPPFAKEFGWEPVLSPTDCVVVGRQHLAKSPALTLYLDILHEVFHLFQRRAGRNLWDVSSGYAGSPTELEAYAFAVEEARRLGASERYLRNYLKVTWIDAAEYARLLKNLGVPLAARRHMASRRP